MEIQWGDNYIIIDKTVAMLIVFIPLVFVLQVPRVSEAVGKLFSGAKKKLAQKYPGHYGKHREV